MIMKIDLHTHAKWSKDIPFSMEYYREMMQSASSVLDAVALTEHFHTKDFTNIYETLDRHAIYQNHYYIVNGVKVFPGIEVDVLEGGHILLISTREAIVQISRQLEPYRIGNGFIPYGELIELADSFSCIKIGAHPFREENPLTRIAKEELTKLDALDINGRDLHKYGLSMEKRVIELASLLRMPIVMGSDSHHPLQFGCVYNELLESVDYIDDLKEQLILGNAGLIIENDLHEKVNAAECEQKKYKQLWKVR